MIEAGDVGDGGRAFAACRRPRIGGHEKGVVPDAHRCRWRQTGSVRHAHCRRGGHRRRSGGPVLHEVTVALVQPHREDFVGGARDEVEVTVVIDVHFDRGDDVRGWSDRGENLKNGCVDRRELKHRRPRRKAHPQPRRSAGQEYDRRNEAERAMDPRQQHCVG